MKEVDKDSKGGQQGRKWTRIAKGGNREGSG